MAYEPFASRSRAVLIGVSQYEHADHFANLPSVNANLTQLRDVLISSTLGRMIPSTVETVREPRSRQRVLDAVKTAAAQAQDLLFVYFSGHGYLHLEEGRPPELHLMCRDSTKTGAHLDAIPYEGLLRDLTASPADVVVLVLDCCFSGTAGRVPLPERRPMALITSAKPLGRIGNGNGIDPTPFTAAVLRVLREGTSTHDPVTVGSLGIRLTELAADQAVPPSADHGPWVPTELSIGGAHNTVLSQARLGGTVPRWQRILAREQLRLRRLAAYVAFVWTWVLGPGRPAWHRAVGGLAALALLAGGITGYRAANRPAALCPAPLELRVLTSTETRAALTSVLDAFQESRAATDAIGDRPQGCGQINTTVYSAPANKVVDAFRHSADWAEPERTCTSTGSSTGSSASTSASSGASSSAGSSPDAGSSGASGSSGCESPLRDVGPHPDVWIPASATTYDRVLADTRKPESVVELGSAPRTLADSPAVVAATRNIPGAQQTGRTLAQLVRAARAAGLSVRNAAPRSSEAALHLLLHLPAGATGTTGPRSGVLPEDDRTLACDARLARGTSPQQQLALLVAESTAAALDTPELDSRPPCLSNTGDSYAAYYPSDVPPLRLSYVPVTWETGRADRADRDQAVDRLGDWLTSAAGQRALAAQGFRHGTAGPRPGEPLNSAAFAAHPRTGGTPPDQRRVDALLDAYRGAAGTRRDVVFAVDVSSSAYGGDDAATIRSVLTRAAASLTGDDRYGITAVPGSTLLPLGTHSDARLATAVRALRPVRRDAPVTTALSRLTKSLAARSASGGSGGSGDSGASGGSGGSGARTPLLVLITDDEDSPNSPRADAPDTAVPVVVVSLEDTGCDLAFNTEVTARGGACIDTSQDLSTALADTIAQLTAGRS